MIIFDYKSRIELEDSVGKRLDYIETCMYGPEYVSTGTMTGANRPHVSGKGLEFFANVTMQDGLIVYVNVMDEHGDEHLIWDDESPQLEQWEIDEALADYRGDEQWLNEDN